MKDLQSLFVFFLLLFTLMGCSSHQQIISRDIEERFNRIVPVKDMNQSLELRVNNDEKVFKLGTDIPLIFYNKSSLTIFFPIDSYIKLLVIRDDNWLEIRNKNTYSGLLLISPQGTPLKDFNITGVRPVLDNTHASNGKEELLRIVLIGEFMEGDVRTGNFVGAYVDVYISP